MKNFIQRITSGAVFVAVLLFSILYSPYTFAALFVVVSALGVYEFHKITSSETDFSVMGWGIVGAMLLFACVFLEVHSATQFSMLPLYGIFLIAALIVQLFRAKAADPVRNWAYLVLGQVVIALPFALLNQVVFASSEWQPALLLAVFLMIWANDSFAYLFGVTLGRHKMFPRVSPKKSWEGFIGGALMSLVVGYLCWRVLPLYFALPNMGMWMWLVFAEVVVVFGTIGDLMESLLKRRCGVKDSSNLIPGHGGVLDRFDSMLMAVPVLCVVWNLFTLYVLIGVL